MNITDYGPLKETKSHFDSDFLYNTYPCSIPLDFTEVPLHWHNEMELIYIKKGCMIVSVDLEYSVVNAGDIVVVMPGHIHSIIQNESDSCEYENILFNLDMLVSRQCDYDTVSFFNGISGFKGYCPPVISKTVPHYSAPAPTTILSGVQITLRWRPRYAQSASRNSRSPCGSP